MPRRHNANSSPVIIVSHLIVVTIVCAEPGILEYRRRARKEMGGIGLIGVTDYRTLDREVPVGYSQLWVDLLQAVLEGVGYESVVGQETKTLVKLQEEGATIK